MTTTEPNTPKREPRWWQFSPWMLFVRREPPQIGEGNIRNEMLVNIPLDRKIPLNRKQYNRTDEFSFVLKPSNGKGIGVFATHGIAKGTRLALFPNGKTRFFSHKQMEKDHRLKKFCQFYGVGTAKGRFVPSNFGCMSVGWYLNHSLTPNAHHEGYEYFASRNIDPDEEITIDYRAL